MIIHRHLCDFCGDEIPKDTTYKDLFGFDACKKCHEKHYPTVNAFVKSLMVKNSGVYDGAAQNQIINNLMDPVTIETIPEWYCSKHSIVVEKGSCPECRKEEASTTEP